MKKQLFSLLVLIGLASQFVIGMELSDPTGTDKRSDRVENGQKEQKSKVPSLKKLALKTVMDNPSVLDGNTEKIDFDTMNLVFRNKIRNLPIFQDIVKEILEKNFAHLFDIEKATTRIKGSENCVNSRNGSLSDFSRDPSYENFKCNVAEKNKFFYDKKQDILHIIDLQKGNIVAQLQMNGEATGTYVAAINDSNTTLVTHNSKNNQLTIWDLQTNKKVGVLNNAVFPEMMTYKFPSVSEPTVLQLNHFINFLSDDTLCTITVTEPRKY